MMVPNFFVAFVSACRLVWYRARGYKILAEETDQALRRAQCAQCDFRSGDQCSVCTCFILAKTALNPEQCPKRYWLRIKRKSSFTDGPSA
jgi:hypothetical protein